MASIAPQISGAAIAATRFLLWGQFPVSSPFVISDYSDVSAVLPLHQDGGESPLECFSSRPWLSLTP